MPGVARQFVGEVLRVTDAEDLRARIMAQAPGRKGIEARCDFRWRGGTLMINNRRFRPSRTAASFPAMSSTCQFVMNRVRGLSSRKQRVAKLAKSSRRVAAHSPRAVSQATVGAGMVNRAVRQQRPPPPRLPLLRSGAASAR